MSPWEKLAHAVLREWIVSGDPLHGSPWLFWCQAAGVDPEDFRATANDYRRMQGIV